MKDLKLSLIVQALDRATEPLRKIGEGLKGLEERAEHLSKGFKKLEFAEILGGGLAVAGVVELSHSLFELTDKTAELGEGFLHASIKAGASVETMQRLGFAAKQLGVDQDGLSQVFFRFQTHLANALGGNKETIGALKLLGISLKDLKTLSKDPHEAFMRLVEGFSAIHNPTVRAKLAMDLFSRSGYQILPMLTAGREEIEKFEKQLDAAHAVMSTEDARASEEFIQHKNQMSLAMQGLQMRLGVGLMPVMTKLVEKLQDVIVKLQPAVVTRFADSMGKLIDQLPALINLFGQLMDFVAEIVPKFLAFTDKVGGLKTVLIALGAVMAGEFAANVLIAVSNLGKLVEFLKIMKGLAMAEAFLSAAGALFSLVPAITSATEAMALLDIAMDANPIGVIVLAIGLAIAAVAALAFGVYELITHWKPISGFFAGLWEKVVKSTTGALTGIEHAWSGLTAWFSNLLKGVENAFADSWKRITAGMPDWAKTLLKVGAIGMTFAAAPALAAPVAAAAIAARSNPAGADATHHVSVAIQQHITSDGQLKTKKIASSAQSATVNTHRGQLPD